MSEPIYPSELSLEDGVYLVRLARRSVEHYFEKGEVLKPSDAPEKLMRPGAAFVTIEVYEDYRHRSLRGCIGFIEPRDPLAETVARVAVESAVSDPRFPPMSSAELDNVTFEVSVLSPLIPMPRTPEERLRSVRIGRDGLVAAKGIYRGLLLPQVPVEYGWDPETFLSETCLKAGMPPHCWLDPDVEFYRYEARVFREKEPYGEVEERSLEEEFRQFWGSEKQLQEN